MEEKVLMRATRWVCAYDGSENEMDEECKLCGMTFDDNILFVYEVMPLDWGQRIWGCTGISQIRTWW